MLPTRVLLACAVLACFAPAQARILHQSGSTSDFTNENNTLLLATTTVGNGDATAASAAACITLCLDDPDCTYWSWCPANETAGCTVPGINGGASSVADASACLLTYDAAADQLAVFVASGAGIAFAGGRYNPSNAAAATSAPGSPPDPANPVTFIDPAGTPKECNGWFTGDQWAGDEIECHVCNGDYQLKCDLDTDLIGDDSVKCEFDSAGLGAFINNAIEFDCVVDFTKTPQNQCDWVDIASKLPTCAVEPVRRILATWRPDE